MSNVYPAGANPAEGSYMQTTAFLRKQMIKMVVGVLLFFMAYCVLLSLAVIMAAGCIAGGVLMIIRVPDYTRHIAIPIGIAMMILGVMLVIFLVKFLFRRQKPSNPYRMEIFAEEHPGLFAFIHQLALETKVRFPKRIFLVPDVNAGVFYNSSFLSMFWPSGKNLEIGMGLVNSLNISEFRMALAHEFGHFTQRSMAVGTYVYSLNKVVHNILYENEGWNTAIMRWSGFGLLNIFFSRVTVYLANGIQYLLRKMYTLLNRQYMKLRREMEFHADAVALSVCGTQTAVSTMRRTEMSIFCFANCLQQLPELAEDQLKFFNIYEAHLAMIRHYAIRNNVPLDEDRFPVITDDYFRTILTSQVKLGDQWATHPTREERERRYLAADIPSQTVHGSAWSLFNDAEQLQEAMSALIYELEVPDSGLCDLYAVDDFISDMEAKQVIFALPRNFHEYYDNRPFPTISNPARLPDDVMGKLSFYVLYNPENSQRIRRYFMNRQDAETLQAIADGDIKVKFFEFQGIQYPVSQARTQLPGLQKTIELDGEWLRENDQLAFGYHYTCAIINGNDQAPQLLEQYHLVHLYEDQATWLSNIAVKIMESITYIFGSGGISVKKSLPHFDQLRAASKELQTFLDQYFNDNLIAAYWEPALHEQIIHFLSYDYVYLLENELVNMEIQHVHAIISGVLEHFNNSVLLMKKELLEMMLPTLP
jgi:Zn-dependent protease with chaperone function